SRGRHRRDSVHAGRRTPRLRRAQRRRSGDRERHRGRDYAVSQGDRVREDVGGDVKREVMAMDLGISAGMSVVVALMVIVIIFLTSVLATMYRKAGPHEALVVYGFRGTRVVKGH